MGAGSCDDPDLLASINDIVDHHRAQIITNSWDGLGEPDPATQGALLNAYKQTFLQAAAQGTGIYFSSGGNGDEVDNSGSRVVDYPSSDTWITGVDGTSIGIGKNNNYQFETGWGPPRAS